MRSAVKWGIRSVSSALAVALGLVVVLPTQAFATDTDPSTGNDVSYPQCGHSLPSDQAFGIVGVNNGLANNANPCFLNELTTWAALSPGTDHQPAAAVYVNTGNPALTGTWWPTSNRTHAGTPVTNTHGTCAHKAGEACAYVYGYSMAEADATTSGLPSGTHWWLDVETGNTWQSDTSANRADLSGMTDYFTKHGGVVGIYSTSYQLGKIAGSVSSTSHLAGLASWVAGSSLSGAGAVCQRSGLTPRSRVSLVQYVTGSFDTDLSCGVLLPPAPTVTGVPAVGRTFTATTEPWTPDGVKLSYQWLRSGAAISHATSSTYKTNSGNAGRTLSVRITGSVAGYTVTSIKSAVTLIGKVLTATPKPRVTGTNAVGHRLTGVVGTWHPGPVTLSYQWKRDGIPISLATSKTYVLTDDDGGHAITLTVTGSRTGYTSVSETSSVQPISF